MKGIRFLLPVFLLSLLAGACASSSPTEEPSETTGTDSVTVVSDPGITGPKPQRLSPTERLVSLVGTAKVTIEYGAPAVKNRTISDSLVPYDKVWRTGANEATWIQTDSDLLIDGERLPAGKYALFTIPQRDSWTVIFNRVWDQWGAFDYDENEDALRVSAVPDTISDRQERLLFTLDSSGQVSLSWDHLRLPFKLQDAAAIH